MIFVIKPLRLKMTSFTYAAFLTHTRQLLKVITIVLGYSKIEAVALSPKALEAK